MAANPEFDRIIGEMQGRPRWRASALLLLIVAALAALLVWMRMAEIDDVTRAGGRIVPSSDVQIIQASETGVLLALHVREGDLVEAGQLLMELDPTVLASEREQALQRAAGLRAQILRLQAQVDGAEGLVLPPQIEETAPAVAASEAALFLAERDRLAGEIAVLEEQRVQRRQERAEAEADLAAAMTGLALTRAEIALIAPLVERRNEPETTLIALRRDEAMAEGTVLRSRARIERMESALAEIDTRIEAARGNALREALSGLSRATAALAELEAQFPAIEQRLTRTGLRSPVRGIVNQLHLTTLGGLARAGEPLVEIVPVDDSLMVQAAIRPSDIAFLHPGQMVRVKLTAYDFSRYGALEGEITRIGADAVRDPATEQEMFPVTIRTSSSILDADGAAVQILPGMVAEVEILNGRRRVMDYFIAPVMRVRDRAFRE